MTKSARSPAFSADQPLAFIDLAAQRRRIAGRIDAAVQRVFEHGQYILGPEIASLEQQLTGFCGARFALSCSNGTDALTLALRARDVGPGDAVFVPSFTFTATAGAVAGIGATPVFVDVLPDTFNMDPASLEAGIATARRLGLRPAVTVPVDLFGQPADYDRIEPVVAAHGMWMLVDAAQSFGATYRGRRVGEIGLIATTSFFPAKPLGCYGDGGAVFTGDEDIAEAVKTLRMHGQGRDKDDNTRIGMNGRMDTLQAAILLEKLAIFEDEIVARQRIADRYSRQLSDVVAVPRLIEGATSVWAQYTLLLDDRDGVAATLRDQGIPTGIYYSRPLHRRTAFASFPVAANGLPVADDLAGRVLSLPMHPYLEPEVQDRIVEAIREAVRRR